MTRSETQTAVTLRFIGSGDAFGSGGCMQTCFFVEAPSFRFLIDCGCSSMIGLATNGIDPDSIDAIVLTHFHGDHCGGVAFLLFHAMAVSRRTRPLKIAGPIGTQAHITRLLHILFPGSEKIRLRFELQYFEVKPGVAQDLGGVLMQNWDAIHTAETNPTIVRVEVAGKSIVYTGDTAWTPMILDACNGADLLVTECYHLSSGSRWHMDYANLQKHRSELNVKKIVLTHPSQEVLAIRDSLNETLAFDGLLITV